MYDIEIVVLFLNPPNATHPSKGLINANLSSTRNSYPKNVEVQFSSTFRVSHSYKILKSSSLFSHHPLHSSFLTTSPQLSLPHQTRCVDFLAEVRFATTRRLENPLDTTTAPESQPRSMQVAILLAAPLLFVNTFTP